MVTTCCALLSRSAQAQVINFTNASSSLGVWNISSSWTNGPAIPSSGGATNHSFNFTNALIGGATLFSANALDAGGASNLFLNRLKFWGNNNIYITTRNGVHSVTHFRVSRVLIGIGIATNLTNLSRVAVNGVTQFGYVYFLGFFFHGVLWKSHVR